MQAKTLFSLPVLCVAIGLMFAGVVGCGGGDGDGSDSVATTESGDETTESSDTTTEAGDDSVAAGNAAAPSGDTVRAAKVEIEDFAYHSDPVTIEEGGKVIWVNRDSAPHTATAEDGSFDTGTIEEGKLKSESFKGPGTYEYVCSIHPEMHGTVEVVEAG